jgi:Mycolic acid cyclopropane synthetase
VVEATGLVTTDVEVLRIHYAWTLGCWLRRFRDRRQAIRERMGEQFCRTWEFYLASSEASFLVGDLVVFQVQLGRTPFGAPLTRDYLFEAEKTGVGTAPARGAVMPGERVGREPVVVSPNYRGPVLAGPTDE